MGLQSKKTRNDLRCFKAAILFRTCLVTSSETAINLELETYNRNLAARGRRLIGRVAGAAGPDRRRGEAGDAQASSRSRNKADGCAPPATQRAPGVCRRRTALLVVDDALASPPRRALPADARSLAHGLSGLLPRAASPGSGLPVGAPLPTPLSEPSDREKAGSRTVGLCRNGSDGPLACGG